MVLQEIKFLLSLLPILAVVNCSNGSGYEKGFLTKVNHTVFLNKKSGWSAVNKLKDSISLEYLPKSKQIVIIRESTDTLRNISRTEDELKLIVKSYGKFRFIGEFYDDRLPAYYSHLMYVNTENSDVMQLNRMTVDKNGKEEIVGAIVYMVDSINYAKEFKLLSE